MAQSQPSSLIPAGGQLVNVRDARMSFSSLQIEVFHVFFFLFVLFFIVGHRYWEKASKEESGSLVFADAQ